MIHTLEQVLDPATRATLQAAIERVRFVDGRATNPGLRTKHNLQVPQNDPGMEEPGRIVRDALFRHPGFARWAVPKTVSRPTISRYEVGMRYGRHSDAPIFPSTPPMRSDLSCTVFISPPETYEGGELVLYVGDEALSFKLAAGDAILYPTEAIHEVRPVTSGVRNVAILWIHSRVQDTRQREILGRLHGVMETVLGGDDEDLKLEIDYLRSNLTRMWMDV
ncbi:MAG: Fe2+-dependent dioxygenase [Pseudomonadota bacterium]